jgi:outer membrane protein with beta-barrel domain
VRLTLRLAVLVSAVTTLIVPTAHAQHRITLVELGIDASFAHDWFHSEPDRTGREVTTNVNTMDIPLGVIRAGFFITQTFSIEPAFGLRYQRVGDLSTSETVFDIGVPIYFSPDRRENQIFVRPVVGLNYASSHISDTGPNSSDTQFNFGIGLGIKMPMSDRFAGRVEVQYRHGPKSDHRQTFDMIAALAGVSVYVH